MSFDQIAILVLLLCMFIVYALDRFPVEHVAATGLAVAFMLGLVPVHAIFAGFANPAVITVVEILLIVSVLARTHAIDRLAEWMIARVRGERAILAMICGIGAFVSVFMNNIGALALMIPVTLSVCARLRIAPGRILMPLSFATLLGGTCSLTGTPANLIVNDWMIRETGAGLGYFTLGVVGLPVTVLGIGWLVLTAPRLLAHFRAVPVSGAEVENEAARGVYLMEIVVPAASAWAGQTLPQVERGYPVVLHDVTRRGAHVFARRDDIRLAIDDTVLIEGTLDAVQALQDKGLVVAGLARDDRVEAVVMPDSTVLGSRIEALDGFADNDLAIIGLASRRHRVEGRFGDLQIGLGDVLVMSGSRPAMEDMCFETGLLALSVQPARRFQPDAYRSAAIFALGVLATAVGLVPPEIAFGAVVLAMALLGSLRLRHAMQDVNWTIVLLLACMIPLGAAVQDTGAARMIANGLVSALPWDGPVVVLAAMLVLAAALTTFVDNVSTAAVLSPIAAGLASRAGGGMEPLLMAVALGTSLDFLTPFGHHNNTVVMGAAQYRFRDFPRLGLGLMAVCLVVAFVVLVLAFR